MIRHDHESVEDKWFPFLYAVDLFNSLASEHWILEERHTTVRDRGDEQGAFILDEVSLGHVTIIHHD